MDQIMIFEFQFLAKIQSIYLVQFFKQGNQNEYQDFSPQEYLLLLIVKALKVTEQFYKDYSIEISNIIFLRCIDDQSVMYSKCRYNRPVKS